MMYDLEKKLMFRRLVILMEKLQSFSSKEKVQESFEYFSSLRKEFIIKGRLYYSDDSLTLKDIRYQVLADINKINGSHFISYEKVGNINNRIPIILPSKLVKSRRLAGK